jgi:hypothetical protein
MGSAVGRSLFVAAWLAFPAVATAADVLPAGRAPLVTAERFTQRLVAKPSGNPGEVEIRETRDLTATLRVALAPGDADGLTETSLVGIRIGSFEFERALGDAVRWAPGRRRAAFVLRPSGTGRAGLVRVEFAWTSTTLRVVVRSTADAPVAVAHETDAAGALVGPFDSAARLGAAKFHFAGTVAGRLQRSVAQVLDAPTPLARIALKGSAQVASDAQDDSPPVVQIVTPAEETNVPPGVLLVTGAMHDDRTIARVTYMLGGGPEVDVPFSTDPATGYLGDVAGSFSFEFLPPAGRSTLYVRAYDVARNSGIASVDFLVTKPGGVILAAAFDHVVVRDVFGRVQEWGFLGGSVVNAPRLVAGLTDVRDVTAGTDGWDGTYAAASDFSVALLEDGTLRAWGVNASGEFGDGTTTSSAVPVVVPGIDQVVQVSADGPFVLALRTDGTVWSWGDNTYGDLGDGTTTPRHAPAQVPGLPKIQRIAAGGGASYAIDEQRQLWSWGENYQRQLGYDTTGVYSKSPARVLSVYGIVDVAAFAQHVVAVAEDGTAWSWGMNAQFGAVAQNTTATNVLPGKMLTADGGIVVGLAGPCAVGYGVSLMAAADGSLVGCTGRIGQNYGQLGDGTTSFRQYVVPVSGLTGVVRVASSSYSSYAVLADGAVRAWGQNDHGQLGDGGSQEQHAPVPVTLVP